MSNPDRSSFTLEQSRPQERLDTFLRDHFPTVSRGAWQRLITQGAVRVNNQIVKPTHAPRAGELVTIDWPQPQPSTAQPEEMAIEILFEDDDLLVLNKPAGLVVHPAAGHSDHTLVNALLHHCAGQLSGIGGVARPGIVHRLDKETSGCLVVAKNDSTHLALASQFARREIDKIYLAIVCGHPPASAGEIRAAVARHPNHRKRMAVTDGGGREAWTSYRLIESFPAAALVEARLHTGRTHQVRVHFQHLGCPLAGDTVYGRRQNTRLTETTGCKATRHMLHAWKLGFFHPRQKQQVSFQAPWPEDFTALLRQLRPG
ncbi:MAG TPA: RluA family pseudouridine synthase [Candidatus Paceibacterota bacterium]|nr:RluA family pseudouridine synthase [Verrucomicrobiota bacterium]HRY50166.1 RluA family pseudouridine synthase [Candidatus Paceibacterota bacterium]